MLVGRPGVPCRVFRHQRRLAPHVVVAPGPHGNIIVRLIFFRLRTGNLHAPLVGEPFRQLGCDAVALELTAIDGHLGGAPPHLAVRSLECYHPIGRRFFLVDGQTAAVERLAHTCNISCKGFVIWFT